MNKNILLPTFFIFFALFSSGCSPLQNDVLDTPSQTPLVIEKIVTVVVTNSTEPISNSTATQTEEPVFIPDLSVTVPAGIIFLDDFENGPDPLWEVMYGNLGMANGKYTVISQFERNHAEKHFAVLSDYSWSNVRISTEIAKVFSSNSLTDAAAMIVVRYFPTGESIGLMIYPRYSYLEFGLLDSSKEWNPISGSRVRALDLGFSFAEDSTEIVVEGIGNTYFAYVNGERVTSTTIDMPTEGQVGLWFLNNKDHGDTESYSIRFESIEIESLP